MAKKIRDENGNVYVQKKPIYKKWWFWLLSIILIISISSAIFGDESKNKDSNSASISKKEEKKTYKVGDEVTVGKMGYRINSVEVVKSVGPSVYPTNAKDTFLVISLSVKNAGDKAVMVDSSFFKLKDGSKEFEADSMGSMSANQGEDGEISNSFFLQNLNPDVQLDGKVVFDVTEQQANAETNQLQVATGAFGTETELINLH